MKCANCDKHEGTETWIDHGSTLDLIHGLYEKWCKCCCIKVQLEYAKERAAAIPDLEKKLSEIQCGD